MALLIAGNINVQTRVPVESFPLVYEKVRYVPNEISDTISGVAWNVARAAAGAGAPVRLASLLGRDALAVVVRETVAAHSNIDDQFLLEALSGTPRSIILENPAGEGAILTDLKDQATQGFPADKLNALFSGVTWVHITNIEWALEIGKEARRLGLPVSTDLQAIQNLMTDEYNQRFAAIADVVLFSGENLTRDPEQCVREVLRNYPARAVICTMGKEGVILGEREAGTIAHQPAQKVPRTSARTGAGDCFAGSFVANLLNELAPASAARLAQEAAARWLSG